MTFLHLELFALLVVANAAPILGRAVLGGRGSRPLDGGHLLPDGRAWLGPSKTWRGLALSVVSTALAAWVLGHPAARGALMALCAMAGDLLSSFVKRRLGLAPGSRALGLDQIPESVLPLLAVRDAVDLSWTALAGLVAAFAAFELLASRLLFRAHLRERPH